MAQCTPGTLCTSLLTWVGSVGPTWRWGTEPTPQSRSLTSAFASTVYTNKAATATTSGLSISHLFAQMSCPGRKVKRKNRKIKTSAFRAQQGSHVWQETLSFQALQSDKNKEAADVMSPRGLGLWGGAGTYFSGMSGLRCFFCCCYYLSHVACQGMTYVGTCCDVYTFWVPCEMWFVKPSSLMRTQRQKVWKGGQVYTASADWNLNSDRASLKVVVINCAHTGIPLYLRQRRKMALCHVTVPVCHEFPTGNSIIEFWFIFFETESQEVAHTDLKLTILPHHSLGVWDCMHVDHNKVVTDSVLNNSKSEHPDLLCQETEVGRSPRTEASLDYILSSKLA